jgi:hypothetical protein
MTTSPPFAAGRFGAVRPPVAPEPPAPPADRVDTEQEALGFSDEPAGDHTDRDVSTPEGSTTAEAATKKPAESASAGGTTNSDRDASHPAATEQAEPPREAPDDKPKRGRGRPRGRGKAKDSKIGDGATKTLVVLEGGKVSSSSSDIVVVNLDEAAEGSVDAVGVVAILQELKKVPSDEFRADIVDKLKELIEEKALL